MTSWLIILVARWHCTDLHAESSLQNTLCAILVLVLLIAGR